MSFTPHRWTIEECLPAWEAGAIGKRVELLDGEVWDVSVGRRHGRTTMRVGRASPNDRVEITTVSLPTGASLPDPDCTVLQMDAVPVEQLSPRMQRWAAEDVLLVVEVSGETVPYDLGRLPGLLGGDPGRGVRPQRADPGGIRQQGAVSPGASRSPRPDQCVDAISWSGA